MRHLEIFRYICMCRSDVGHLFQNVHVPQVNPPKITFRCNWRCFSQGSKLSLGATGESVPVNNEEGEFQRPPHEREERTVNPHVRPCPMGLGSILAGKQAVAGRTKYVVIILPVGSAPLSLGLCVVKCVDGSRTNESARDIDPPSSTCAHCLVQDNLVGRGLRGFVPSRIPRKKSLSAVMVGVPRSKGCRTCLERRVKVRSFRSSFEPPTLGFPFR